MEVTYNEIQRSPRYPAGFALRFARITRVRDDKGPLGADTVETLAARYEAQFTSKARLAFESGRAGDR